jgi:hypothetical protein
VIAGEREEGVAGFHLGDAGDAAFLDEHHALAEELRFVALVRYAKEHRAFTNKV